MLLHMAVIRDFLFAFGDRAWESFVGPSKDLSLTFGNYCDDLHDVVVLCGHLVASGTKRVTARCISQRPTSVNNDSREAGSRVFVKWLMLEQKAVCPSQNGI